MNKVFSMFHQIAAFSLMLSTAGAESNQTGPNVQWSQEDLTREVSVKHLGTTAEASFHFIRLQGAEQPHIHDRHDLTVFVLLRHERHPFQRSRCSYGSRRPDHHSDGRLALGGKCRGRSDIRVRNLLSSLRRERPADCRTPLIAATTRACDGY